MYNFRCLSHIVDGFILPAGMRVWVVCTHTRTHLPDGYMMLPIYVPAGRNIIPYPSPYRVKPVGYLGFGYPLTSLSLRKMASLGTPQMQWSIRFAMSTDGVNPLGNQSSIHSSWPVVLSLYNLQPLLCKKQKYMILTILVSGPMQHGDRIDVSWGH
jgi:hypothetical protein